MNKRIRQIFLKSIHKNGQQVFAKCSESKIIGKCKSELPRDFSSLQLEWLLPKRYWLVRILEEGSHWAILVEIKIVTTIVKNMVKSPQRIKIVPVYDTITLCIYLKKMKSVCYRETPISMCTAILFTIAKKMN